MANKQTRRGLAQCGVAAAAMAVTAVACVLRPQAHWGTTTTSPDALLVWTATWAAWLLAVYLVVGASALCLARLLGRDGPAARMLAAVTPAAVRRSVDVVLGAAVSTSIVVATPLASEAVTAAPGPSPAPSAIPSSLAWPVAHPAPHRPHPSAPSPGSSAAGALPRPPRADVVVVQSGDTLWDIAARHLPRPTAARIARAWPGWWTANRAVIGSDPNLIHPGDRLRTPVAASRRLP